MDVEHCVGKAGPGRQHASEDWSVELRGGEAKVWRAWRERAHSIKHSPGWLGQDVGRAKQIAYGRIVLSFTEQRSVGEACSASSKWCASCETGSRPAGWNATGSSQRSTGGVWSRNNQLP
jgi:hypothetical protein